MIRRTFVVLCFVAASVAGGGLVADESGEERRGLSVPDESAAASRDEGLLAWKRIYDVFTHPRCVNCHVGKDNLPLWTSSAGSTTQPHGMLIDAGDSRIGAETLQCSSCHQVSKSPNTVPHAAPHTGMIWRLAPVEFQWTDRSSTQVCEQVRNPETNGGRDPEGLIEHIVHDAEVFGFISWAFDPGPKRSTPPGSLQDHLDDMVIWTSAGMPCPDSEHGQPDVGGP